VTLWLVISNMRLQLFVILLTVGTLGIHTDAALTVEVLQSVGGLPPHIVGRFEEPIGFQQTPGGPYYVFDRRGHTVYAVDSDKTTVIKLVEIGPELGRIVQPRGFDTSPTGAFVVADAPRGIERVQIFGAGGLRLGGFTLPARQRTAALRVDSFVLNGIASIQYAGDNLLVKLLYESPDGPSNELVFDVSFADIQTDIQSLVHGDWFWL